MAAWKRIRRAMTPKGDILVTNNIKARNAFGAMSHVWLTGLVFKNKDPRDGMDGVYRGDFYCLEHMSDRMIAGLTHYCEIPSPSAVSRT